MKEIIKKQNRKFDILLAECVFGDGDDSKLKKLLSKIRKEIAELVCNKMTGTERLGEGWSDGYNARIEEEEEIKQRILKEIYD
ncbi:hypothetical protein KAU51_04130 [Candidatus Parcubacteria bacterium]|nr:hypothetical protein [Candidatus Parcubacteria bacterium]